MIVKSKFKKIWGAYPWPDTNRMESTTESKNDNKYLKLIKEAKKISEKWLFSQNQSIIFDDKKRNELFLLINENIPNWKCFMQEKIEIYISWLGCHEGLISK